MCDAPVIVPRGIDGALMRYVGTDPWRGCVVVRPWNGCGGRRMGCICPYCVKPAVGLVA